MASPILNSYWLIPNAVICGEYPRYFDDYSDEEGIGKILEGGAQVFVNLTEDGELNPYCEVATAVAENLGIACSNLEFHRHPIRDGTVPTSFEAMQNILDTMNKAVAMRKIIYLHCWGGRGRTGTVAGCFLADHFRINGDEAFSLLQERWRDCAKSAHSPSPETDEQVTFIRNWR